eukprot:1341315-Amorphochlora_amoeboformis.AAC.1
MLRHVTEGRTYPVAYLSKGEGDRLVQYRAKDPTSRYRYKINEVIRRYTSQPVFCIIDVDPKDDLEIPTQAYVAVPDISDTKTQRNFVHVPSEIGALEAEEVGVEHLLRDIRDTTVSTLSDHVDQKVASLKGLKKRMDTMATYLKKVADGELPLNHQIIYNLQDIFNLCPNLQVKELVTALKINTNDNMLVIYVSSLIRSIIALHNLINNKLKNKALEKAKKDSEKKKEAKKKPDDSKTSEKDGKKDEKAAASEKSDK